MRITKIHKVDKEPLLTSPSSPLKTQPSISKIAIPHVSAGENEMEPHQPRLPMGKTNLKQLHHFLRNQLIVVRQKERLISNHHQMNRLGSITELNRSITRAICLKADEHCTQPFLEGNIPTVCLPKIEREEYQRLHLDSNIAQKDAAIAVEQNKPKNKQTTMIRHNHGTRKRLSTLGSRMSSIENSPLISNASRHISRARQAVREYLTESKAKTKTKKSLSTDVVDFSLYRQCPQLNRISLNLAMEVSKCSSNHK